MTVACALDDSYTLTTDKHEMLSEMLSTTLSNLSAHQVNQIYRKIHFFAKRLAANRSDPSCWTNLRKQGDKHLLSDNLLAHLKENKRQGLGGAVV